MLILRSHLVIIVTCIAAVAAMESAFMMLLVATVTNLGPVGPYRLSWEALSDLDPVIVGSCLLMSIAALRSGLSRAVLIEAGRVRRRLEEVVEVLQQLESCSFRLPQISGMFPLVN